MEGEFASPRQLVATPVKQQGSGTSSSLAKRTHMDISLPPISFESSPRFTRLQPLSARTCATFSLPAQSPLPVSIMNTIVSPPRVFIQEFGRLPPFFSDSSAPSPLHSMMDRYGTSKSLPKTSSSSASMPFLTSCLPPPPLPMLSMPPIKKKRVTPSHGGSASAASGSTDRKQLRCSYPDCPNLRRSAGFCNRHSGKVCSMEGCNKSALSRGKCPEHGGGSRCKKEGCSKFAQTRGLCKSHGGGRQCRVSGCAKNAHQNRLCRSHGGGKRCDFHGCPKWAQRSGYCCAHTKLGKGSASAATSPNGLLSQVAPVLPLSSPLPPPSCPPPAASPTLLSPHRLLSLLP
jgi:hypothetical protein